MTKYEKIFSIEEEIRKIFAKDNIKRIDVIKANDMFDTWKFLTNYRPSTGPVVKNFSLDILDDEPKQIRNLKFIKR